MPSSSIKKVWKETWASSNKRLQIITGTVIMLVVVFILPSFFGYIEKRKGVLVNDWLLAHVPSYNVSVPIFVIIWGMIIFIFIRVLKSPAIYIKYCWTLLFVSIARLTCIALVPLEPPVGLKPLIDPLSSAFYGYTSITKDLFFSGHTATMVLIVLCLERRTDKIIAAIATFAVASLLVVQHIHYTLDIVAAPLIVYVIYRATSFYLYRNTIASRSRSIHKMREETFEKAYSMVKNEAA